ncbi:probable hydrolase PNKD [Haliotis cracherodii]|uniref:probable hydrolase PNKD n=1 Tax=Haliotis cracherodii TaxID=6455 RepID=UPI0039EBABD3
MPVFIVVFTSLCEFLAGCWKTAMAKAGGCFFRIGYFLYTRTRVGYYYHQKEIKKAREKLEGADHSNAEPTVFNDLSILPIPMLLDNYAYLITDRASNLSVVVDPGDPEPVQKVLTDLNITPEAILITHKHWDHSGGNEAMKSAYPNVRIFGGAEDHVPNITNGVVDGEKLTFGGLKFTVMFTPGHTVGHVVYHLEGHNFEAPDCLFSGDHVFLSGCGRMFEGTPVTMLTSLDKMCELHDSTLIWPGHEYATDNLEFACHVDNENSDAEEKLKWAKAKREQKRPTCPSTVGDEKKYNPFLRTGEKSVLSQLGLVNMEDFSPPTDQVRAQALGEIRERKDKFKYKL